MKNEITKNAIESEIIFPDSVKEKMEKIAEKTKEHPFPLNEDHRLMLLIAMGSPKAKKLYDDEYNRYLDKIRLEVILELGLELKDF